MTHAYNCTVSKTTGFSSYFLMYGREPQLPINVEFSLPGQHEEFNVNSYVERLLNKIDIAFQRARENIAQDAVQRKQYHDKNVRCHDLKESNIILVCRNLFDSQYKIADKWEEEPYRVVSQMDDTPVYRIKAMDNPNAPTRVLHRNMLHPACSVCDDEGTLTLRVQERYPQCFQKQMLSWKPISMNSSKKKKGVENWLFICLFVELVNTC